MQRAKRHLDPCDDADCPYNSTDRNDKLRRICCFGGFNAGLLCYQEVKHKIDMSEMVSLCRKSSSGKINLSGDIVIGGKTVSNILFNRYISKIMSIRRYSLGEVEVKELESIKGLDEERREIHDEILKSAHERRRSIFESKLVEAVEKQIGVYDGHFQAKTAGIFSLKPKVGIKE